jgi:hypothetical protein
MGNTLGRIEREFVLVKMEEQQIEIAVHGERKRASAKVLSLVDLSTLRLKQLSPSEPIFMKGEPVRLFFNFFDHTMTFEGSILEGGEELLISIPNTVVKNLQRKFERVPPPEGDIHLSFDIASSRIELDFPRTSQFAQVDQEEMIFSSVFDASSIQGLLEQFNQVIAQYAEVAKIRMFREKKPETFEELVVASGGNALFLPDTSRSFPSLEEAEGRRMVVDEELPLGDSDLFCGKKREELKSWLLDLGHEGILSELVMPICYREYVIGVILLQTGIGRGMPFTLQVFDICSEFASILVHSLQQNGYFAGGKRQVESYEPQIVNISASGLLFTHSSAELASQIGMYSDLSIRLTLSSRPMQIACRVMRKYHEENRAYYGLQFMEMKPEDFRYLFEAVYGRSFTERDDRLWEGGAKPPEVVL